MENKLSCNISVYEEEIEGNKIFVVECGELGISDHGESIEEAFRNLGKAIYLLMKVKNQDLQEELNDWELASLESLKNFEKQI